jgi:hypothetical protein
VIVLVRCGLGDHWWRGVLMEGVKAFGERADLGREVYRARSEGQSIQRQSYGYW